MWKSVVVGKEGWRRKQHWGKKEQMRHTQIGDRGATENRTPKEKIVTVVKTEWGKEEGRKGRKKEKLRRKERRLPLQRKKSQRFIRFSRKKVEQASAGGIRLSFLTRDFKRRCDQMEREEN